MNMDSDPDECIFETDDQGHERRMVSASPHRMEANPVQHNQNAGEEESSNDEAMDENLSNQVEISGIPVSIAHDNYGSSEQQQQLQSYRQKLQQSAGQKPSCSRQQNPHFNIANALNQQQPSSSSQHTSQQTMHSDKSQPMSTDMAMPYDLTVSSPFHQHHHSRVLESSACIPPVGCTTGEDFSGFSEKYREECTDSIVRFNTWTEPEQVHFVENLLHLMCHYQHGQVNNFLKPMLQRDFISVLPERGLTHIAETILSYLDERSLCAAELVCHEWYRVIQDGHMWRRLIEHNIRTDSLWRGLSERNPWGSFIFTRGSQKDSYYRTLYPTIVNDIKKIERNWRCGNYDLKRIQCRSDNSKGVYCLQYDDHKIVSGLRDNTIKLWDRKTLENTKVLTGHTGSVLCLQYDKNVIITGSSDSTVRVWDVETGEAINTLVHHCEAVLHLRFDDGLMVTCSKDRSIAVWDMVSPREINMRRVLVGHRAAVNVVDFDDKYIVSASGDRTIKVWVTKTCEFVRTLNGHKRGIACLQYRDQLVVSGSSDNTIRLWDIQSGACLRILEGHEELVRCIRFDNKRIVSGAYDGKIKVWDLQAALDQRSTPGSLCIQTLSKHTGRVFRLQFDEFQIVSSSHDDSILIWDFLNVPKENFKDSAGNLTDEEARMM